MVVIKDDTFLAARSDFALRSCINGQSNPLVGEILVGLPLVFSPIIYLWLVFQLPLFFALVVTGRAFPVMFVVATHFEVIAKQISIGVNEWTFRVIHFRCPNCKRHLPSTLTWQCPDCFAENGDGDNRQSYFARCRHCTQFPDALLCPSCKVVIQLSRDQPETIASVVDIQQGEPGRQEAKPERD